MNRSILIGILLAFTIFWACAGFSPFSPSHHYLAPAPIIVSAHTPETNTIASKTYAAALDVARVFGRSGNGCAEASPELITLVANEAIKANLDPRVFAATISVESACNQYATSTRGAIGLTQVRPIVWKAQYDFEHKYNLLNQQDNLRVGASILGALIQQFGETNGLRRYNGMGVDCDTCDTGYVSRIVILAGRKT